MTSRNRRGRGRGGGGGGWLTVLIWCVGRGGGTSTVWTLSWGDVNTNQNWALLNTVQYKEFSLFLKGAFCSASRGDGKKYVERADNDLLLVQTEEIFALSFVIVLIFCHVFLLLSFAFIAENWKLLLSVSRFIFIVTNLIRNTSISSSLASRTDVDEVMIRIKSSVSQRSSCSCFSPFFIFYLKTRFDGGFGFGWKNATFLFSGGLLPRPPTVCYEQLVNHTTLLVQVCLVVCLCICQVAISMRCVSNKHSSAQQASRKRLNKACQPLNVSAYVVPIRKPQKKLTNKPCVHKHACKHTDAHVPCTATHMHRSAKTYVSMAHKHV